MKHMETVELILKHFGILCLILWIAISIIYVIVDTLFRNTKFIKKLKEFINEFSQYKVDDIIIRIIIDIAAISIILDILSYLAN